MPLSESILSNVSWNKLSLKFDNSRLEAHYQKYTYPRFLKQSRLALLLGAMVYEAYGLIDYLLITTQALRQIEVIRITTTFAIFFVFASTFTKIYKKYHQALLISIVLVSGFGLLWKMSLINLNVFSFYFSALLLLLFWVHAFNVLQFKNAFLCSFAIVLTATYAFLNELSFNYNETISYLFILASAFGVSIFATYIAEKSDRALFLRESELDRERYIQRERATHDSLTTLPNRVLLVDRIEQAIHDSKRSNQVCAGFYLDLDNFKAINDTYGHAAGDYVLMEVSARLKANIRAADTVARLSGDEFFVLARDIKNDELATAFGNKLLAQISLPYFMDDVPLDVILSASIGVCMFPYQNATALDVINRADQAMYQIKLADKSGVIVAETY